jgi:hypothetical protein
MRVGLGNSAPALGDGSLKLHGSGRLRPVTVPCQIREQALGARSAGPQAFWRPALAGVRWLCFGHLLAFRRATMRSAGRATVSRP